MSHNASISAPPGPSSNNYRNQQYTSTPFLYGDGFLTRMFGRRDAALFIELLLKIDARNVHLVGNVPGWHNAMMTKIPSTQDARVDALGPNNQPLYLLDFIPPPIYHVVPQKIWTPPNQSNWRRYVEQASLHMPVFFIQNDGTIGLPLERALRGDSASLRLAGVPPPLGGAWGRGYSTRIRITVSTSPSPPPPPSSVSVFRLKKHGRITVAWVRN
jgi:hypothetical protein